jgi:hypothetical protein
MRPQTVIGCSEATRKKINRISLGADADQYARCSRWVDPKPAARDAARRADLAVVKRKSRRNLFVPDGDYRALSIVIWAENQTSRLPGGEIVAAGEVGCAHGNSSVHGRAKAWHWHRGHTAALRAQR